MLLSEDICTVRWPDIPEQLFPGNSSCGNTEQMFLPEKSDQDMHCSIVHTSFTMVQVAEGEICPLVLLGHTQKFIPKQQLHKLTLCK